MTKQGDVSIITKAIQSTKNIAHKVITSYLLFCCGLILVGGIVIVKLEVVVNAQSVKCSVQNKSDKVFNDIPCNELDVCKGIAPGTTTGGSSGSGFTYYCNFTQESIDRFKSQVPKATTPTTNPTTGGTGNIDGKTSSTSSSASTTPSTPTPETPKLKELALAPKTAKDPCESAYGGQVRENSENFDCSKNSLPVFTSKDELSKTQPGRVAYIEAMCKNVNGSKDYSSPTHNQKWSCVGGKLSGQITNITNDPIKRSQIDEWQKTVKKGTSVKLPAEGSEYLGKNLGCAINKTTVRLLDLPNIGNFVPIIPTNCTTAGGYAIPMSPVLLAQVIVRFFGFLASFIFYLINFVLVYNGLMWVYGGVDGKSQATAKRNIGDLVWALVLLLGAYVIISTIVGLIGAGSVETDLSTFFNNNTKI